LLSTRAESYLYRSWDADIIGMTALPEAKLAREAEICYSIVAAVTDYDCWHEEDVTVEMVIQNLTQNAENLKKLIKSVIPKIPESRDASTCPCCNARENAVLTKKEDFPEDKQETFELFFSKYM